MSTNEKERERISPSLLFFTGVVLLKDIKKSALKGLSRGSLLGLRTGIDFLLKRAEGEGKPETKRKKIEIK